MSPLSPCFLNFPGAISSCLSPSRLRFIVLGAMICEIPGSSWWDFIWRCNNWCTDWLSRRDYPYWSWAGCRSASIYSFNYERHPAASMCARSHCSQGWQFSQPGLNAILIKDFCPCYKLAYFQQFLKTGELLHCGLSRGFLYSFLYPPVFKWNRWFLLQVSTASYVYSCQSTCSLISELCWTPLHMAGHAVFMHHCSPSDRCFCRGPLRAVVPHWSDDMIRDCGVLMSHITHGSARTTFHPVSVCRSVQAVWMNECESGWVKS